MGKAVKLILCLLSFIVSGCDGQSVSGEKVPGGGMIMTVRGPIRASEFGKALSHEHIMCDWIGAEKTGKDRYDAGEIIETVLPYLKELRKRGFTGFVDCMPAWFGRDAEVLKELSEQTGLHILTNTGYYGAADDKYVPGHAYEETAEQLAVRWAEEWENGIDGTGIRPGFIKTAVDRGALSDIDRKLVTAAAKTHLKTGLTIACHTTDKESALEVLEIVLNEGAEGSALIVVHADSIKEKDVRLELAAAGAWLEYDSVGMKPIEEHVRLITEAIEDGIDGQLLLSHDAGCYLVGEKGGGMDKFRAYTVISDELVGALKKAGVTEATIHKILVETPAKAFEVKICWKDDPKQ